MPNQDMDSVLLTRWYLAAVEEYFVWHKAEPLQYPLQPKAIVDSLLSVDFRSTAFGRAGIRTPEQRQHTRDLHEQWHTEWPEYALGVLEGIIACYAHHVYARQRRD